MPGHHPGRASFGHPITIHRCFFHHFRFQPQKMVSTGFLVTDNNWKKKKKKKKKNVDIVVVIPFVVIIASAIFWST
jgi:hypothetical protein